DRINPFLFQAEDGIRYLYVTGVQTCALPICRRRIKWHGRELVIHRPQTVSLRNRRPPGRAPPLYPSPARAPREPRSASGSIHAQIGRASCRGGVYTMEECCVGNKVNHVLSTC